MLVDRCGVGEQPDAAGQSARERAEIAAHPVDLTDDDPRVLDETASGRRQRDAATIPHQQWDAERVLHAADACARGSKRHVRPFCAMRDAARLGNAKEQPQVREIETHGSLLNSAIPKANYETSALPGARGSFVISLRNCRIQEAPM